MNQMSNITTTVGSAKLFQSRMNEMCFDAGVIPSSSLSHDGLADHLGLAAQAEAALPGDLDVVVEETDRAHPAEEEQQQQRGPGGRAHRGQLRHEVAGQGGQDDHDAAHGRRAELGVVAGRPVVADLLAEAQPAELVDRDAGAEEGDEQRDGAAQQDGSHRPPLCVDPDR
jgi:hypothetical protein